MSDTTTILNNNERKELQILVGEWLKSKNKPVYVKVFSSSESAIVSIESRVL